MIRKLWILAAFVVAGFSLAWVVPKDAVMKKSRLSQELPESFGDWVGEKLEPSDAERKILAKDTEFARMNYANHARAIPQIQTSFVFSGRDMNNSIHKPEVCLRAQGWNFERVRTRVIKGALPGGRDLPVREIVCSQPFRNPETLEPILAADGSQVLRRRVQYYTFFGYEHITESHYDRVLTDMKERLLKGRNQQWAYATFSMPVTESYTALPGWQGGTVYDLEQSTLLLEEFIRELLPTLVSSQ